MSDKWTAEYNDDGGELWFGGAGCGLWSIETNDHIRIYLGGYAEDNKDRMDELARIICAAPDMLEALETGDADKAIAAIKKARGYNDRKT